MECAGASGLPGSALSIKLSSHLCRVQKHVCAALTPAAGPLQIPFTLLAGPVSDVSLGACLDPRLLFMALPSSMQSCMLSNAQGLGTGMPLLRFHSRGKSSSQVHFEALPRHLPSLL